MSDQCCAHPRESHDDGGGCTTETEWGLGADVRWMERCRCYGWREPAKDAEVIPLFALSGVSHTQDKEEQ